ncbi:MAG: hypothetical protein GX058_03925 [Firmicutes bacterium]|nr:hypothetical protein [Bacillota bacterium]
MIYAIINALYWLMITYLSIFLLWNLFTIDDLKEQIMSVLVLIPFILRIIGIK